MASTQIDSLKTLFDRDLDKLTQELELFQDPQKLWTAPEGVSNPAGTLILHLCGNLQHFIGATLGSTGYVRQRDLEFSRRDVTVKELKEQISVTKDTIVNTLSGLSPESLEDLYPLELWKKRFTTGFFLIHLHSHLNYHLGQINYLRRILQDS